MKNIVNEEKLELNGEEQKRKQEGIQQSVARKRMMTHSNIKRLE